VRGVQAGTVTRRALADAASARWNVLDALAAAAAARRNQPAPPLAAPNRVAGLAARDSMGAEWLDAVTQSWTDIWVALPSEAVNAAVLVARDGLPAEVQRAVAERDALAAGHETVTAAADSLAQVRGELTGYALALLDQVTALADGDDRRTAWVARRQELWRDLDPPTLNTPTVVSRAADFVASADVRWSATHPNGNATYRLAVRSTSEPQAAGVVRPAPVGRRTQATVFTAAAGGNASVQGYEAVVESWSRAGAVSSRTISFDVPVPGQFTPDVGDAPVLVAERVAAPSPLPTLVVRMPYAVGIPLPMPPGGALGNAVLAQGVIPQALPGGIPPLGAVPSPPAAPERAFVGSTTDLDIDVDTDPEAYGDGTRLDVALGSADSAESIRRWGDAPMVRRPGGVRLLLRGLTLPVGRDIVVRVRASRGATTGPWRQPPLRLLADPLIPRAPLVVSSTAVANMGGTVTVQRPTHAPSGVSHLEYLVTPIGDAATAFRTSAPLRLNGADVPLSAAELVDGITVYVHVRAVSVAGVPGLPVTTAITPAALQGMRPLGGNGVRP
jgi:hypothetical protein